MGAGDHNAGGVTLRWTIIPSGGSSIIPSCFNATDTRVKLQPDGLPGSYADFT